MGFTHDFDGERCTFRTDEIEPLWFLAYTRPRLETVALQNLQQQGFDAYLPFYKRLKKSSAGMQAILEPMFHAMYSSRRHFKPSPLPLFVQPVAWRGWLVLVMKLPRLAPTLWQLFGNWSKSVMQQMWLI